MAIKKHISIFLNGMLILAFILFVLDGFTSFEIKNQIIKSFAYFGIIIFPPLSLIWNIINFKAQKWKIIGFIFPAFIIIGILILGPLDIVVSSSAWKTQKIIYKNKSLNFNKVEFQIQDVGALGYNKRTVEVIYLTNLFMIVNNVENNIYNKPKWIKIDKKTNELKLP